MTLTPMGSVGPSTRAGGTARLSETVLRRGAARGSADAMASLVDDHAPSRDGAGRLTRAVVLGAASGVRTFSAPAALAAHGRLGGRRGRFAVLAVAAGELAADKSPVIPDRTGPPALGGRVGAGALVGHRVAGGSGALAAAAGAAATTFLSHRARTALTERLPVPGAVVGAAEDAVVLCAVALAPREPREAGDADDPAERAGQVGRRLLRTVLGRRVPRRRRAPLNQAMHWLYGTAWVLPLGLVTARGRPPRPLHLAPALGLGVWAASLVELPLLGVAEPIWRRPPGEVATDAGFHLVYGFATAAALRGLRSEGR
jgi:uncharacterized membrane protein